MANWTQPKINKLTKVPGNLMPVVPSENKIKDITKLTQIELLDLKRREENLLSNKARLKLLPDKGARVRQMLDKVLEEIKRREDVDTTADMFSKLNIATRGVHALNELEWTNGKLDADKLAAEEPPLLQNDDDQSKALRAMAHHNKKVIEVDEQETTLITANDLLDIANNEQDKVDENQNNISQEEMNKSDAETAVDKHTLYLINIAETSVTPQREKFKPHKSSISNVHDPAKERMRKTAAKWENTAATPPLIKHDGTKMLTLMESVNMQIDYLARLKEIEEKHAVERMTERAERLALRPNIKLPSAEDIKVNSSFNVYRSSKTIEGELKLEEEDEVHDPLVEEKTGGIIHYTYTE